MDFKTFFVKRILMSFFISVAFICAIMALIGMAFESDITFGYEAFLSPLIFGAVASLPSLVTFSKDELSFRQTAVRNIIHLLLLEAAVLSVLYIQGLITSVSMAVSLGVSIFIIDLSVNLILWINDRRSAREFNEALRILQNAHVQTGPPDRQ